MLLCAVKVGAKKALLRWCQQQVTNKFGVEVNDFGKSWRDGNAFLGIVNSIKPGMYVRTDSYQGIFRTLWTMALHVMDTRYHTYLGSVDIDSMAQESNSTRLETAFYVAEVELGVTR